MADYYPLISRAVSALDPNTLERRDAIYKRAREALDRQLLSLDPPIPESDLRRERGALEATIRRVETEFAPPPPPFRPADAPEPTRRESAPDTEVLFTATTERPADPLRPKVALGGAIGFLGSARRKLAASIGLPVVLVIAALAYMVRDDPARYLARAPDVASDAGSVDAGRKSDVRLDGTSPSTRPGTERPRPAPPPSSALPIASRVMFFEESPADPRGVQSDGMMVWRLESANQPGQPSEMFVRGSMTVPGAKMSGEFLFKRNRNAALPASHTIELIFRPEAGRDGIREISPIEARDQEANPGVTLQAAMVPVATNLFLIGLDKSEAGMVRNLGALRDKRWFAFQFRDVSGKLGAILIEKGQTGERIFREALASWQ